MSEPQYAKLVGGTGDGLRLRFPMRAEVIPPKFMRGFAGREFYIRETSIYSHVAGADWVYRVTAPSSWLEKNAEKFGAEIAP